TTMTNFLLTSDVSSATELNVAQGKVLRASEDMMVVALIVLSLYLTVASFAYQWKQPSLSALKGTNRLCSACAVMLLVQSLFFEVEMRVSSPTLQLCYAYYVIVLILATINKSLTYCVLWVRQRSFYKNPKSQCMVYFGNAVLTGIIVLPILQVGVLMLNIVDTSPVGCITRKGPEFSTVLVPFVFMLFVVVQLILLGLVLRPIVRHIMRNKIGQTSNLTTVAVRLSVCTTLCVFTDLAFLTVAIIQPKNVGFSFGPIVFHFNSTVNVAAMLCSFADYSERLMPF
uniref:G-protein coupled receptors family 1 profile domain-containing protein n=1 Tax=Ciona intestinalis TaxID=7719 RepID=H2XS12_CIOIN